MCRVCVPLPRSTLVGLSSAMGLGVAEVGAVVAVAIVVAVAGVAEMGVAEMGAVEVGASAPSSAGGAVFGGCGDGDGGLNGEAACGSHIEATCVYFQERRLSTI